LLALVDSHASLIERRLSLYSSAANHTVAEATGLVYAGVLFPELVGADRWRSIGVSLLEREIARQILPDGGGAERSFAYLKQIADFATLARQIEPQLDGLAPRIAAARRLLGEVNGFEIGDDDDGHALSAHWRSDDPPAPTDVA